MILALFGAGAIGREFRMIAEESGEDRKRHTSELQSRI